MQIKLLQKFKNYDKNKLYSFFLNNENNFKVFFLNNENNF